jgi:hypothetical protein
VANTGYKQFGQLAYFKVFVLLERARYVKAVFFFGVGFAGLLISKC